MEQRKTEAKWKTRWPGWISRKDEGGREFNKQAPWMRRGRMTKGGASKKKRRVC
jgi:hypothetical protein